MNIRSITYMAFLIAALSISSTSMPFWNSTYYLLFFDKLFQNSKALFTSLIHKISNPFISQPLPNSIKCISTQRLHMKGDIDKGLDGTNNGFYWHIFEGENLLVHIGIIKLSHEGDLYIDLGKMATSNIKIGQEAAAAIIDLAFDKLGYKKIQCIVPSLQRSFNLYGKDIVNDSAKKAVHLVNKIGMVKDGEIDALFGPRDSYYLTKEHWENLKKTNYAQLQKLLNHVTYSTMPAVPNTPQRNETSCIFNNTAMRRLAVLARHF